jgi:hypothetical protein
MFVLSNNATPRGVVASLRGHVVQESRSLGTNELKNGDLLDAREAAGFKVLLTTDKNIRHQQNLSRRKIAIVVLGKGRCQLIRPMLSQVAAAVNTATPGSSTEVVIPER